MRCTKAKTMTIPHRDVASVFQATTPTPLKATLLPTPDLLSNNAA